MVYVDRIVKYSAPKIEVANTTPQGNTPAEAAENTEKEKRARKTKEDQ